MASDDDGANRQRAALVLDESTIRRLITVAEAHAACREAFAKLGRGEVDQPSVMSFDFPQSPGEVHVKGGHLHGSPFFSVKVASGFYRNPERGLPVTAGCVWVFSATTGSLEAMLLDNGFLTELRTGAAGAVAADALARREIETVGIIGSGGQARYQLEALLEVRRPARVLVWSPTRANTARYAEEMREKHGVSVEPVGTAEDAVRQSDLVITTTPARAPVVRADWVRPGTHLTAMGSDLPAKVELEPTLLAGAKVVADRLSQCATQGEIHHAIEAGVLTANEVYAELGEIVAGFKPGRTSEREITVADLTGVGALDAAMANLVVGKALERNIGRRLEVGS
jgi:ornithine cyclodeaminase